MADQPLFYDAASLSIGSEHPRMLACPRGGNVDKYIFRDGKPRLLFHWQIEELLRLSSPRQSRGRKVYMMYEKRTVSKALSSCVGGIAPSWFRMKIKPYFSAASTNARARSSLEWEMSRTGIWNPFSASELMTAGRVISSRGVSARHHLIKSAEMVARDTMDAVTVCHSSVRVFRYWTELWRIARFDISGSAGTKPLTD